MSPDKPTQRAPLTARRDEPVQQGPWEGKVISRLSALAPLLTGLALIFVGFVALGIFSWQQSLAQEKLQHRFDKLTQQLQSTDAIASQSGAALAITLGKQQEEISLHWAEIKKLWGVANDRNKRALDTLAKASNTNIKAIASLQKVDTKNKASTTTFNKSLSKALQEQKTTQNAIAAATKSLKALQSELSKIRQTSRSTTATNKSLSNKIAGLDKRLQSFTNTVNGIKKQEKRINELEQATKSIDAFRKQTNQKFIRLQTTAKTP